MTAKRNKDVAGPDKPAVRAPQESAPPASEKRRPVRTIRVEDCSASIWARTSMVQGKPKTFLTVSLERSYKDRDGAWKYTKSFDPDSLGKVVSLCQEASEVISELEREAHLANKEQVGS